MNKENKPCPFCGNKYIELQCYPKPSYTEYIAVCDICWCEGPAYGRTPEEAWEKWNTRKGEGKDGQE